MMLEERPSPRTTLRFGRHDVPGLWASMLPEEFRWQKVPGERRSTCDDCFNVAHEQFRDDCRCCTYFPQLPNFMLGLALEDESSRAVVEELINSGNGLPMGLIASPERYRSAVTAYAEDGFGNLPEMLCPFVEPTTFHCRVYAYRNSVCSTFFCAYDHGDSGEAHWGAVQALVGRVESALSWWALDELGLPHRDVLAGLDSLADRVSELSDAATGGWSLDARRVLWGAWLGREAELYRRCAELVTARAGGLYELARAQPFVEALEYERAVRSWIPPEARVAAPQVAEAPGMQEEVDALWYRVQLTNKRLWALPFGEGRVALADGVAQQPTDSPVLSKWQGPVTVSLGETRIYISPAESALLGLFARPQLLGEQFFARPEVSAVDDARGLLAEWLRQGILEARPS